MNKCRILKPAYRIRQGRQARMQRLPGLGDISPASLWKLMMDTCGFDNILHKMEKCNVEQYIKVQRKGSTPSPLLLINQPTK